MKAFMRKVMCVLLAMVVMTGVISPQVKAAKVKYKTYTSSRYKYSVKYPSTLTKKTDSATGDGTKVISADGKVQLMIWNSYGASGKRTGTSVVETAKKNRKIKVIKSSAKEANYYYNSGKNIIQYYYCFLSNGEIAFQIKYPKKNKSYYNAAVKGMIKSVKKNKSLTLSGN